MRPSFFQHLHSPTIPRDQARLRYTLGAGGFSVFLTLVLIVTGILEMFYYLPTPGAAAGSIQTLNHLVPFGGVIRNIHYWAAQLLVISASLHLLRVIFTGAYTRPRDINYLLGLGLLVLVLLLSFSGTILRWDEGIRWALVAGTNLLKTIPIVGEGLYLIVVGGEGPGEPTLIRFYTWHVFGLTLALVVLGVWHMFRFRRDGGIAVPPPSSRTDRGRISREQLVRIEGIASLVGLIILFILSVAFPAPTSAPLAESGVISTISHAPWYFLWIQDLLHYGDPFWLGIAIPAGVILLLSLIPYVFPALSPQDLGRWFPKKGRAAQVAAAAIVLLITSFSLHALVTN